MHYATVLSRSLEERLDSGFYAPSFLRNDLVLRRSNLKMSTIGAEAEFCNCGSTPKKVTYSTTGTPLIRGAEIRPCVMQTELVALVEGLAVSPSAKSAAVGSDLVYTMSGASLGDAAVVPDGPTVYRFTNTVVRARFKSTSDSRFVAAFLSTQFGRGISKRYSSGGDRGHVMPNVFRRLPLPVPNIRVQSYIGSKIRQAEALREWANGKEGAARAAYSTALNTFGPTNLAPQRTFKARLTGRLDPAYYEPRFTAVLDSSWLAANSVPLGKVMTAGAYGCLPESGHYGTGGERLLRATDLDDCNWNPHAGVRVPIGQVSQKALIGPGDVLIEVKGAMTRCVIAEGLTVGCYANGTIFRLQTTIDAGYLVVHLTGPIRHLYCSREGVNNIIEYLNLDSILRLPVLRLSGEVEGQIGRSFRLSITARSLTAKLLTAARFLVEALIERKLTELDLITTSQSPDADRALLARLKTDGLDGAGAPLFPDLDALTKLVADATQGGA